VVILKGLGMTAEQKRLAKDHQGKKPWRLWGPYLSDRQWGTVREDYSPDGAAWDYFTHDHARSRAYRWGEDGLAGVSDDHQRLCLGLPQGTYVLTLHDDDGYSVVKMIELPGVTPVVAEYSVSESEVFAHEPISFSNLSSGALNYLWNFGDGAFSTDADPLHEYTQEGIYDVMLLAENGDCSSSKTSTISILKNAPAAITETPGEHFRIYGYESTIYFDFGIGSGNIAMVQIYNALGQKVVSTTLPANDVQKIILPEPGTGAFLVKVVLNQQLLASKILVTR